MLVRKLRLNTVLEKLWQHISVDFIMMLPVSRDYNSILVVCDRFSKMLQFYSNNSKNNSRKVSKVVRDVISNNLLWWD